jgi:outer membrane receptor for ferrienterochelin and colicin
MVTPSVLATPNGKGLYVRGSRSGATSYIVDGNKTMQVPNVPGLGIAEMEVLTGGIPAEYGDCTGGVVIITTKDYMWEASRKKIAKENKEESEGEQ